MVSHKPLKQFKKQRVSFPTRKPVMVKQSVLSLMAKETFPLGLQVLINVVCEGLPVWCLKQMESVCPANMVVSMRRDTGLLRDSVQVTLMMNVS